MASSQSGVGVRQAAEEAGSSGGGAGGGKATGHKLVAAAMQTSGNFPPPLAMALTLNARDCRFCRIGQASHGDLASEHRGTIKIQCSSFKKYVEITMRI